jgi:TolB-like protein/tetratricopeptide (TPR) repeat protein
VAAGSSKAHRIAWLALALLALTAGLAALWRNTADHGRSASIRDVAVLPFQNLSGNPDDELLAHAVTDGLISELARLDGFGRVIAHGSVLRYKTQRPSVRDIADELNVQGLITGTVTRTDSRVSVHVELIDARTERQLWSDTLMPGGRTIVDLQREVVRNIVRETRINVTPRQRSRLDTAGRRIDPEAYDSLVRARAEIARINYPAAVAYFERALSKDPEMAEAWAELALALVYQAYGNARETIPRARADADRALQLDPDNAAARVALGRIRLHVDWDWDGAGRELRSAISLDPHSPEARWQYGFYLGVMGRMDESLEQSREAVRLDPHSPFTHYALAFQLRMAGHYADAVREFTTAIALAHDRPVFIAQRALSHVLNGECALADADLAASGQIAFAGFVAAKCGRPDEARRVAAAAPREKCAADVYAALHDYDAAFACLEQRYASRDFSLAQVATAPIYADLHGDPRFGDLLRRMQYPR